MYTEDDEDVKVKNKSSNNDYNDFYTSFSESEEKTPKKEKGKIKKEVVREPKDEDDYSDFYGINEEEPVVEEKDDDFKKKVIKIGIIVLLTIVLIILLWVLFNKKKDESGDIELSQSSYTLKVGEKEYISYKIVDTDSDVTPTFTSSNPSVVSVDANGEIIAVSNGEATIKITYDINGTKKEKECTIKVDGPEVKHELSLDLKSSASNWTNKDVTITVNAKSDSSVTSLKYAINCSGNCQYTDVKDNKIVISTVGTTKVTVVAKDKNNLEMVKEITTKIDKEAPKATLSGDKNITSNKDVSVCVACSDSLSGCKQAKVCKTFISSKSNQVITVYDNAGNSKSSETFNVTINKVTPLCTLKVSKDGVVSATLKETGTYYGFNSDYSGNNELSKAITISASKKGEKMAKVVYYYVKTKNGNTGSCAITVIKECTQDNTCTFRSN